MPPLIRAAVVQHPPVLLHRAETLDRGVQLVAEAAGEGAQLISFPETWVPGYPEWLWRLSPGNDQGLTGEIYSRLLETPSTSAARSFGRSSKRRATIA